jgi:Ca2+-binding RTX toxin-like protein
MYNTAACFWLEVLDRGGLPAIRRALASIRADYPLTSGDLIVRNVSPAVGEDLRPIARRYGFDDDDLVARDHPLAPASPACRAGTTTNGDVRVGTIGRDKIQGTRGNDFLCGLAGNDRISGGAGSDVLQGGAGADLILARDGRRDLVYCGTGRDRVRADRGDRVARTCERVKRPRPD